MEPHQERVITEYRELLEKYERMCAFIRSPTYDVNDNEYIRLVKQRAIMKEYLKILAERMKSF